MVFWMFFPLWSSNAKSLSNATLFSRMVLSFYLQILLMLAVFVPILYITGNYQTAFFPSTMLPWNRWPVFLMGIYAGELCLRHQDTALDWPPSIAYFFPYFGRVANSEAVLLTSIDDDAARWARIADTTSAVILAVTMLTIIGDGISIFALGGSNICGGFWLQGINPFLQLTVVVALARDRGSSHAAAFLRKPLLVWLGGISMCIYLLHHPLIFYVVWGKNGWKKEAWPSQFDCSDAYSSDDAIRSSCENEYRAFLKAELFPLWGLPIVFVSAIAGAWVLFHGVEEPCRKALRQMPLRTDTASAANANK